MIAKIEDFFCAASLLVTSLVLFANVVLRYLFSASTSWAEELIRYLMIWITFIGGSICVRQMAHIRMDFVLSILPKKTHRFVNAFVFALAAAFCAALCFYSFRLVLFTIKMKQTSPAMGLPMWVPYLAMPLGSALMTWRFLARAWSDLREREKEV